MDASVFFTTFSFLILFFHLHHIYPVSYFNDSYSTSSFSSSTYSYLYSFCCWRTTNNKTRRIYVYIILYLMRGWGEEQHIEATAKNFFHFSFQFSFFFFSILGAFRLWKEYKWMNEDRILHSNFITNLVVGKWAEN